MSFSDKKLLLYDELRLMEIFYGQIEAFYTIISKRISKLSGGSGTAKASTFNLFAMRGCWSASTIGLTAMC